MLHKQNGKLECISKEEDFETLDIKTSFYKVVPRADVLPEVLH